MKTIAQQLQELQHMSLPELQEKFKDVYGYKPTMNRPMVLKKRLAFRIQELHYGGLTNAEQEFLNELADGQANPESRSKRDPLMPGTILIRIWKGKVYETTVMKDGKFEYAGQIFRSLSRVAREITGTQWNGKIFFGVK